MSDGDARRVAAHAVARAVRFPLAVLEVERQLRRRSGSCARARFMSRRREASRSEPLSSVCDLRERPPRAPRSARRCGRGARRGPRGRARPRRETPRGRPRRRGPPRRRRRARCRRECDSSIGEMSANVSADETRSPPIQWSGRDGDAGNGAVAVLTSPPGWGLADPPPASSVRLGTHPCVTARADSHQNGCRSRVLLGHGERDVARIRRVGRLSPRAASSSSPWTIRFESRPMPSASTSTRSPGCTGREFAGVPERSTSPGSSVMSRERSASMYAIDQSSSPVFPSWTTSPFT